MASNFIGLVFFSNIAIAQAVSPVELSSKASQVQTELTGFGSGRRSCITAVRSESQICPNLISISCENADTDDGTGVTISNSNFERKRSQIRAEALAMYEAMLDQELQSSQGSGLQKLAFEGSRSKLSKKCTTNLADERCRKIAIRHLSNLFIENDFWEFDKVNSRLSKANASVLEELAAADSLRSQIPRVTEAVESLYKAKLSRTNKLDEIRTELLPEVKVQIKAKILDSISNPSLRRALSEKLDQVKLGTTTNVKAGALLNRNASYSAKNNTIYIKNGALLRNGSMFFLARVLAHELTHSFDPCNIAADPALFKYSAPSDRQRAEKEFPFASVVSCLRDERSAKAEPLSLDGPEASLKRFLFEQAVKKKNSSFCADDQISEAFPDWVAAEILPSVMESYLKKKEIQLTADQYRVGYARSFDADENDCSGKAVGLDHLTTEKRLKLLSASPGVQRQMRCQLPSGSIRHCSLLPN